MKSLSLEKTHSGLAAAMAFLLLTSPAWASDGVREINQACVADGCFPGDAPGLPVEITQPGSYILTSGLTIPDENTHGIVVTFTEDKDFVTLDLNGFGIVGPVVCSGEPVTSCTPSGGSGTGVFVENSLGLGGKVVLRNGLISGMGGKGTISVGKTTLIVEGVVASHNGGNGLIGESFTGCLAKRNGGSGFVLQGGLAESNEAKGNRWEGFSGEGSFRNNLSVNNSGHGFVFLDSTAIGNHSTSNQGNGFFFMDGVDGLLAQCTALDNGSYGLDARSAYNVGFSECVFSGNGDGSPSSQRAGGFAIGQSMCASGLCT